MDAKQVAAAAAISGGMALANDFDQASATITRSLGPITRAISKGVRFVFGEHRGGTHNYVPYFPVSVGLLAWGFERLRTAGLEASITGHEHGAGLSSIAAHVFAWLVTLGPAGALIWIAYALFLWSAGPKELKRKGRIVVSLVALGGTVLTLRYVGIGGWLPIVMAWGTVEHILADTLTNDGCPVTPSLRRSSDGHYLKIRLPIISQTGNGMELALTGIVTVIGLFFLLHDFGMALHLPHPNLPRL
jgi:hypothetical protein